MMLLVWIESRLAGLDFTVYVSGGVSLSFTETALQVCVAGERSNGRLGVAVDEWPRVDWRCAHHETLNYVD